MLRILSTIFILILIPIVWLRIARPAATEVNETLFNGVTYQRIIREEPAQIIHLVEIDLTTPGISFQVTPATETNGFTPRTTSDFLREFDLQVSINGSFYQESGRTGQQTPLGLVVADGMTAVNGRSQWPALCIINPQQITLSTTPNCPAGTIQAIAGNVLLVNNGQPLNVRNQRFPGRSNSFRPQPRTAVALDAAGETMWLVVVDGRQPNYSQGMTITELAEFLVSIGAHQALNLDGGGSTTLVTQSWFGANVMNSPIHNSIPTRQRAIPTHLGVYANKTQD